MLTLGILLLAAPREAESELHRLLGTLDEMIQGMSEVEEQQPPSADFEAEARNPLTAAEVDAYANRVAAEAKAELAFQQQLEREEVVAAVGTAIATGGASIPGQLASSAVSGVTAPIGNAIYAAKKTVIGSTKYNLLKVANTALYFAINLEKDHGGIPPENKMALVTRLATLSTSSKGRGLSSLSTLASFEREPSSEPPVEHEPSPEPPVDDELERGLMKSAINVVGKAEDKAAKFFGFGAAKKKKVKKRQAKPATKGGKTAPSVPTSRQTQTPGSTPSEPGSTPSKPGSTPSKPGSTTPGSTPSSKRSREPRKGKRLSNNSLANRLSSYTKKKARDLRNGVNKAGSVVSSAASGAGNAVRSAASGAVNAVRSGASGASDAVRNAASSAGNALKNTGKAARNAAGKLGKGVSNAVSGAGKALGAAGSAVGSIVGGALGSMGGGGASGDGGSAAGCECDQPERKPDDLGYKISSTLLGNTRQQLMKIAYNALAVAMLTTDEDTGIPFENKAMLTAKVAMLRTDENARSLFTLASDPMMAGGFALLMNG